MHWILKPFFWSGAGDRLLTSTNRFLCRFITPANNAIFAWGRFTSLRILRDWMQELGAGLHLIFRGPGGAVRVGFPQRGHSGEVDSPRYYSRGQISPRPFLFHIPLSPCFDCWNRSDVCQTMVELAGLFSFPPLPFFCLRNKPVYPSIHCI